MVVLLNLRHFSPCVPSPAISLTSAPPAGALFPGDPHTCLLNPHTCSALQMRPPQEPGWSPGLKGRGSGTPGSSEPLLRPLHPRRGHRSATAQGCVWQGSQGRGAQGARPSKAPDTGLPSADLTASPTVPTAAESGESLSGGWSAATGMGRESRVWPHHQGWQEEEPEVVESEMSTWSTKYRIPRPRWPAALTVTLQEKQCCHLFDSYKRQIKVSCFYSVRFSHPLALPPVLSWECHAGRCSAHPAARPAAFRSCSRLPVFTEKRLVRSHPFVCCRVPVHTGSTWWDGQAVFPVLGDSGC